MYCSYFSGRLMKIWGSRAQVAHSLSQVAVMTLLSRSSVTFAAPVDGWLLHSLHTQQHTD